MKEQIYRIISEISRKEINEISESSYLKNDLNMDSLLVMVVVFRLEKVFKIIITPKEITSLEKVEDIMKLIGTKVKTLEYQLNKKNASLYREIEKVIKFYFSEIILIEFIDNTILKIFYTEENSNDENALCDRITEVIKNYVKGYKDFNSLILIESENKISNCVTPLELNYIEVAHGVRCKIGIRATIEIAIRKKIESLYTQFSPCEVLVPSMIDYKVLHKLGYLHRFPNMVNFIKNFKKEPELIEDISKGKIDIESIEIIENSTVLSEKVLNPVTCYHIYPIAQKIMQQTGKTTFSIIGQAYRFESYNMDSSRLNEFNMSEIVYFGSKEEVLAIREKLLHLCADLFNKWHLDFKIETSADVFFGTEASIMIATQKLEKSKYEIQMKSDKGYLSIGSLNQHNDFFCKIFNIKRDGMLLSSGCTGFGLERLIYCILSQHGEDPSNWPEELKWDVLSK
jgi:acyl carrier protein